MNKNTISITNTSFGLELATMYKGWRVSRFYSGYTRREATRLFKQHLALEAQARRN